MLRNALLGAIVFGVSATVAGYIWVAYEFPFAIVLPAAIGWFAVARGDFGTRKAGWAALVGGISFTAAFLVAMFAALTDGSPVALAPWMSATLAAIVAGAATGWLFGGVRGSATIAGFAGAGMLLATVVAGLIGSVAPGSTDVPGMAQSTYFAGVQGMVGVLVGASVGAGVSWLAGRRG